MVDDDEFIRQIEHEVSLIFTSLLVESKRLELKRKIVAEGPIQSQIVIFIACEEIHDGANHREDGRLFASLLFREAT
jgi:hypothetical protein